jgi:hypothetical protein
LMFDSKVMTTESKIMAMESNVLMTDLKVMATESKILAMDLLQCWWRVMEPVNPWIQRPSSLRLAPIDEVYPRQCPCLGAFDSWRECGRWRIRRLQTETGHTREFTQVRRPQRVKTYIPLVWSCIACIVGAVTMMAQMKPGYSQKWKEYARETIIKLLLYYSVFIIDVYFSC